MLNLKIGEKEYKVKYGYKATLKTSLLSRLASLTQISENADEYKEIEEMLLFVPELLLVGLQKYHFDEFGFDYDTNEGYEEQLDKCFDLVEEYCDGPDSDIMTLFNDLQNEITTDGFLSGMLKTEESKAEETEKKIEEKSKSSRKS